ncbi:hypothetical protein PAXRUDRAFT_251765 [Paxillus rubicundulus Ve08.2h10]|uniref:Uncharacterized protein n=1 Tax=Paxillus rubicundulus Ve08.2h10 TaxID=930991 RepID=A0A0D0CWX2_9AGAM|nr:hypothetical protein PAXRUDRAFT_251765 [Paxillus rubicundulus Ve08.2h10]
MSTVLSCPETRLLCVLLMHNLRFDTRGWGVNQSPNHGSRNPIADSTKSLNECDGSRCGLKPNLRNPSSFQIFKSRANTFPTYHSI